MTLSVTELEAIEPQRIKISGADSRKLGNGEMDTLSLDGNGYLTRAGRRRWTRKRCLRGIDSPCRNADREASIAPMPEQ